MIKRIKKYLYILFFVVVFLSAIQIPAQSNATFMDIDQIKIGMKGKGRTVFLGSKIEEFDVEIIGILHNFGPKRNMIIARLDHEVLKKTGVMEGMSGSPVYINGRLIGAVAYSIGNFLKEPLAGITPIMEMMEIVKRPSLPSTFSPRVPIKKGLELNELLSLSQGELKKERLSFMDGKEISPLNVPVLCSGFSPRVMKKAKSFFSGFGISLIGAGASGQSIDLKKQFDLPLKGGDPIAVQMISGDLEMSAIGTTTYVDGNKVLAFGHPLYNLGAVDFTMTKAKVLYSVPSLMSSFKMAVSTSKIGRFSQDRAEGIFGELGKRARLIPLNLSFTGSSGQVKNYNIFIADNKILTPALTNFAVSNIIASEERNFGDLTLRFTGDIYMDNGKNIHLEDLYSGNFDTASSKLSNLVASIIFYIKNNEFRNSDIHRIDLKVLATEEIRFAYLDRIWLDKYNASPGETIMLKVFYRNFRGQTMVKEIPFSTPALPSGTEFYLAVSDAASLQSMEMAQYRSQAFVPRSFSQLLRLLNNLRKNNRIYFKLFASKPGLFLKGEEMPNLPPSMKSMFLSPRAVSSFPVEISNSTLNYYQIPLDYVFQGAIVVPIKIK